MIFFRKNKFRNVVAQVMLPTKWYIKARKKENSQGNCDGLGVI